MKTFGSMSIRSQIVAMMILLAAAMFGLITVISVKQRNHDLQEIQDLTTRFTRRAASHISEHAESTELLLGILSKLHSVQQRNPQEVTQLLPEIVKQHPLYANLIITDKSGLLLFSSLPFKGRVSYGDRRYFINGISTGRFSSGEYTMGKLIKSPVMTYGFPIKNRSGEITGLAAASIRLESFKELFNEQRLPTKSTILLIDHQGVILYHSLFPQWIGRKDRTDLFKEMTGGPERGSFHASAGRNSNAATYYSKIRLRGEQTPYMYLRVSIPYDAALNKANSDLLFNILFMSSLVLLVIGIASHISKKYIVDKITSLQRAAQKIARGDLGVRIAEQVSGGELGALGHAFDDMAHSLAQDIGERKQAMEALQQSEASLARTQEIAHLGSWDYDTETGKINWSDEAYRIFGFAPQEVEVTADLLLNMIHPDDRNKIDKAVNDIRDGFSPYDVEYRIIHKDGSVRYVHSRRYVCNTEETRGHIYGMVQDITERRKMDQELLKAQKLESIGVLAGGIAHDFNNLLGGVFGYIEMARIKAEDHQQKEVDQYLSKALAVFDRAKELTQQLLTFSKGGAPILKFQSIAEILRRTLSFTLRGSSVCPEFSIPDDLWLIEFDEIQMAQVFDNIAINALQAMPQGGTIDVIAQNIAPDEGPEMYLQKPSVLISIRDHGTGIIPEHLPHIFDPFFTTKMQGSGLGLSTCYSIIKQHGGSIEVDSEVGKGTTFRIILPAATAGSPVTKKGEILSSPSPREQSRILIMDDEPFILDIASTILRQMEYEVVTAANGDEAIAKTAEAMRSGRRFVAAVLDLTIPGGRGGKETAPELVKMDPEMKVIVSSGYSDDPVMARPAEYGFSGKLTKPYRRAAVVQLFDALFGDAH